MAIVDTFTKLIFGQESRFSCEERRIIDALRLTDPAVSLDSYRDMGNYLRALGVQEMISLVNQVRHGLLAVPPVPHMGSTEQARVHRRS